MSLPIPQHTWSDKLVWAHTKSSKVTLVWAHTKSSKVTLKDVTHIFSPHLNEVMQFQCSELKPFAGDLAGSDCHVRWFLLIAIFFLHIFSIVIYVQIGLKIVIMLSSIFLCS